MRIAIAGLAIVLGGCATEQHDTAKQAFDGNMKPAMVSLFQCGDRFYQKFSTKKTDAYTLGVALDSFCAREEGRISVASFEMYKEAGLYDSDKATAFAQKTVDDFRSSIVGRIIQNTL